jgi:ribose transport system permease protein
LNKVVDIILHYNLFFVIILLSIIFGIIEPKFLSLENWLIIIRQSAIMGIFAIGLTIVVVTGEFDISFTAIGGFVAAFCSVVLLNQLKMESMVLVWTMGWIVGIGLGFINAVNVRLIGIPSFVGTLGILWLLEGVTQGLTKGGFLYNHHWPESYGIIGRGFSFGGKLPNSALIFIIVCIMAILILEKTKVGRYLNSIGDNPDVCHHVGIKVNKQYITAFILAGLFFSIAGTIAASQRGSVGMELTRGYILPTITTVFLGSMLFRRQRPHISGTIVGTILIILIENGLTLAEVSTGIRHSLQGVILIVAMASSRYIK